MRFLPSASEQHILHPLHESKSALATDCDLKRISGVAQHSDRVKKSLIVSISITEPNHLQVR
jgi:hypothetical protein